jgi:hypothetical protein
MGGALVPGAYQLVSETLYGPPEPDVVMTQVGEQVEKLLDVQCDVFNERYRSGWQSTLRANGAVFGPSPSDGSICDQLVPHALRPKLGTPPDGVPYSAVGDTLTLTWDIGYTDYARDTNLGSYTVVDQFVLVSAAAGAASDRDAGPSQDAAPLLPAGVRDPRCPSAPPSQGDSCNPEPAPLECEYGGNAWARCTTFAECAVQPDGEFRFQLDPVSGCGPNAPQCPSSFAEGVAMAGSGSPADAGSCSAFGTVCDYAEGVCGCDGCSWLCRSRTDVASTSAKDSCPERRPLAGDPCVVESQICDYDRLCLPAISLGPSMICQHGNWVQTSEAASCPVFCVHLQPEDGGASD